MPYWRLFYHIVWSTKNRLPLIEDRFVGQLHQAMAAKAIELAAIVHAVGGIEDHIHLAVSIPPSLALSQFIGQVKGNSSHFVNYVIKSVHEFKWQEEYGILSFGEKDLPFIVKYIHNQKEHHQRGTTLDYLEDVG
jgi:putative transposase